MAMNQTTPAAHHHQAANRYRQREQLQGGVVVLNQGIPTGWMDRLRAPHTWQPGIRAVDDQGKQWIACGGDDDNGAIEWCAATKTGSQHA